MTKYVKKNRVLPRRILLSFAPVSSKKNIDFLKWLGVEIPRFTEQYLTNKGIDITEKSLKIAIDILKDILVNNEKLGITVHIGLNIEHISILTVRFQKED